MIIDCIADTHGHYPELDGGDLLIVAGNLTARNTEKEFYEFANWMRNQEYEDRIVIAGNHDAWLYSCDSWDIDNWCDTGEFEYLCNSGTEINYEEDDIELEECGIHPTKEKTIKIWGSPHSLLFDGVNPKCTAFMGTEDDLEEAYDLIPNDIDILISHTPPFDTLDSVESYDGEKIELAGSKSLLKQVLRIKPKYLICGHIHEHGGKEIDLIMTKVINCSYVNEFYKPVNKPMRIII